MKKFLTLVFISTLFVSFAPAQSKAPKSTTAKPPVVEKKTTLPTVAFVHKTLPNGLEVIVLPDSSIPLVTVEIAVRNGSFTEPPELNGLSHLYEHMFFKPDNAVLVFRCDLAKNINRLDYYKAAGCDNTLKLKDKIGDLSYLQDSGQLNIRNATTREEVVNYFVTTTSPYLETALRSMNSSIRFPNFDEKELEDEIKVVIGEVDRNESNPFLYLNNAFNEMLFFKYPTRKNPLGTRDTITSATTEKMRLIQSRYYVPDNSAIVVTGDADPDVVFGLVEKIYGSWEKRKVNVFKEFPLVEHPPLPESKGAIIEQRVENVIFQIGWQGPSIGKDNDATYAADVFSYILSQPNSKFQRAMVDSGLTANTNIGYYTQRNVGPIQIFMVSSPEKAKSSLDALYKEIAKFNDPDYFTDEELQSAKTMLESIDLFDREKLTDYAHTLSFWWSTTGIEYFKGYRENLQAVSREDISRYITTYIQDQPHVSVAMMSPAVKAQNGLTEEDLIGKKAAANSARP